MCLRCLLGCIAAILLVANLGGEEPPERVRVQSAEDEPRLRIVEQTAAAYVLLDAAEPDRPLTRSDQLLKFDDPVTGAARGAVYVWSDDGKRPLAIASIYFRGDGARVDEFQSLATGKLIARHDGTDVWRPSLPGLEWSAIGGEVPGRGPLRLAKMRDMARPYAASVSDAKSGRQELRLMPNPAYRYDDADRGIVDGALFFFAKGTNPEVLLLLQAEKDADRVQWKRAFCRMTERECEVTENGRVVWSADKAPIPQPPEDAYFNRTIKSVRR